MGGGGGETTVGYRWYVGMHMVCTMGPVDLVSAITVDKKLAWSGNISSGAIAINAPNLFGGDSSEGGVSGTVDFLSGSPAQGLNAYLASALGDPLVPNFRGVSSFVLNQCYVGLNPYLKPWAFRMQRVNLRQDGIEQWYVAKAGIPSFPPVETSVPSVKYTINLDANNFTPTGGNNVGGYFEFTAAPGDLVVITKPRAGGSDGLTWDAWSAWPDDSGTVPVSSPVPGQTWLNAFVVRSGVTVIATYNAGAFSNGGNLYRNANDAYNGVASSFPLTLTGHSSYRIYGDDPSALNRGGLSLLVKVYKTALDMNPAHILRECLTDPDWGMGYNEADIDDTTFTACADTLFTEGMGMSLLWDTQTDIGEFITTVLNHIDACIYVDRRMGKFVMKLIRNDYVLADLLELTENDIDRVEDFKRPQFGELTTSVTVKYWESLTNTDGTVTIQDIALESMQEAVINTTQSYPGFTNPAIASRAAQRDLRTLSAQIASCTVYTDRTAKDLQIGDVFLMTWPDYELTQVPMRITGVAYGDGKSNRIRLTVSEDVFSLDTVAIIPTPPKVWVDPSSAPIPANTRIAFEFPYLELVQQQTQPTTDSALAADPQLGFIGSAAGRPSSAVVNFGIWTDAGSGYTNVSTGDFCPTAKLTNTIDRMQTVFAIQNVDELALIVLGSWLQIDQELMGVTAISSSSITVTRAALDTLPAIHTAGAVLFFWDKLVSGDPTQYEDAESINVRLTPRTGSGTLELADAPTDTVVLAHRAIRPYPPANLKLNGLYFPAQVTGDVVLTWTHRDRTQQTGGTLLAFTAGSVGPEAGVTYTLKVYNGANALVRTVSGITGTTTTYTAANELADGGPFTAFRMTLAAVRAGFESWQIYDLALTRPNPVPSSGVFIPDTDPIAKDPHIVHWNNSFFLVGIQGKVDGNATQGYYLIPDTGIAPSYIGQLYDGRAYTAGMAPYEVGGLLKDLAQTLEAGTVSPIHANAIDANYSIFYPRRDTTLGGNFRWLIAGKDSTGQFNSLDTTTALNSDIRSMLRTGSNSFAWSIDTAVGSPYKCWKSTDGGNVWAYQGTCTNLVTTAGSYTTVGSKEKIFAVGSTFVRITDKSKVNTAADGMVWVDHTIATDLLFKIADASYDATALVAIGQAVVAPAYDTHVLADTPVSYIDYNATTTVSDKVDVTRLVRRSPNGVAVSGWGFGPYTSALAVSPNVLEAGSLVSTDTSALGIGAVTTLVGTYLEARTAGNAAINFLQGTTDFSIELWTRMAASAPGANTECVLFSQNRTGAPQFQNVLLTFKTTTNVLRLRTIRQTGTSTYATDVDLSFAIGFNIFTAVTTHIVATRGTGGRIFLYVNGAQVATRASGAITDLTVIGTAQLGCVWGNTNSRLNVLTAAATPTFPIIIDAACVYASELSSTRVLDHYNTAIADGLTRNRIWRSTDGATWTQVRDVQMDADAGVTSSYIKWDHVVKFSTGFAVYGKDPVSGQFPAVIKSTNHGSTWGSNTDLITSDGTKAAVHYHVHSNGTRIMATLTTRTVSSVRYQQFAYSTDGITFTDIDSGTFLPGSVGVNLIELDDTGEPRISETGQFRITE